ncbi:Atrial natriuretic peptide receptor 1 [Taenia solium]
MLCHSHLREPHVCNSNTGPFHLQQTFYADVINNKSITFDWDFKLSLMADFVRGMEYLHSTSLKAHGRLKSTNCVVSCRYVLKITDFGIPKIYSLTGSYPSYHPEEELWTAPELLRDETAAMVGTKPGDVYAFGIIMHEVFYQTKPFGMKDASAEEILERVMSQEKPPFRPKASSSSHHRILL